VDTRQFCQNDKELVALFSSITRQSFVALETPHNTKINHIFNKIGFLKKINLLV